MENEGSVEVFNLPLSFPLDFTLTAIDTDTGSATAGTGSQQTMCINQTLCYCREDFFGGRLSFFLSPGATQRCSNIVIINDNALEMFSVVLATVFFPVPIDVSTAAVTIVDTDCE